MTEQLQLTIKDNQIQVSDWYHTFDELYEHRCVLFIALCRSVNKEYHVRASKKHSDWSEYEGRFIMGIHTINWMMITYHLPNKYRDNIKDFALITELWYKWDWHTSDNVLYRLLNLHDPRVTLPTK